MADDPPAPGPDEDEPTRTARADPLRDATIAALREKACAERSGTRARERSLRRLARTRSDPF